MAARYASPVTSKLTKANWREKVNLKEMSLDDMTDLIGDMKALEALGKQVGGFLKDAIIARIPKGKDTYSSKKFVVVVTPRTRAGGLDRERILEDMGEQFVTKYTKDDTEYDELRVRPVK